MNQEQNNDKNKENILSQEKINDWIMAGKIASKAVSYSKQIIKKGESFYDIAEKIESKIRELNASLGFPVNLSTDEFAAHMTPKINDGLVFNNQVVKVDIGTCYNGAIGDTAYTIDLSGKYKDLVNASKQALNNAIKILRPGITLGELGKTIQETIESYGYRPIRNLSGHGLGLYSVHEWPQIPNYNTNDKTELKENQIIAIEPFATTGTGMIKEHGNAEIFSQLSAKPVRSRIAREVFNEIKKYKNLPFARRHLTKKFSLLKLNLGIRELLHNNNLTEYPPLMEINKGIVSQHEHSFIVKDKPIILTKLDDE